MRAVQRYSCFIAILSTVYILTVTLASLQLYSHVYICTQFLQVEPVIRSIKSVNILKGEANAVVVAKCSPTELQEMEALCQRVQYSFDVLYWIQPSPKATKGGLCVQSYNTIVSLLLATTSMSLSQLSVGQILFTVILQIVS